MNVEKSETAKVTEMRLAKSLLNEFKKVHLRVAHYRQRQYFLVYNDLCKLLIITKDSLIEN